MSCLADIVNDNQELTEYNKKEIIDNTLSFDFKKSNTFVVKSCFDFTAVEQNLINYFMYKWHDLKIEFDEDKNKFYKLKIDMLELLKTFNYEIIPNNYTYIRKCIKSIRDKSIEIFNYNKDTKESEIELFTILDSYKVYTRYDKDENKIKKSSITLFFNYKAYKMFSNDLEEFYTTYNFAIVFDIKGKYAKRLYDLFYYFIHKAEKLGNVKERYEYNINYERFCKMLGVDMKYCNSSELKRKVIDPALKEINNNNMCNMNIEYILDKKKKNITFLFSRGNVLQKGMLLNEIANDLIKQVNEKVKEQNEHLENEYTLFDYIDNNNVMHLKKD